MRDAFLKVLRALKDNVGSVRVASSGRPAEPPASLMWASGTRGAQGKPGKPNFAISFPSSASWRRGGKGPPAVLPRLPRPSAPLPSCCTAQESTQNAAQSAPAPHRQREGILRASFPSSPRQATPVPPKDAAAVPCPQSLNVTAPSSS